MSDVRGLEGLLAGAIFVAVVAAVLVYTQVLAPRRLRRRVTDTLRAEGWVPADASLDEALGRVERLAIEGPLGADWNATYDERLGPVTSRVRVAKTTRGASEEVFRDAPSTRQRYAGIATTRQTTRTRTSLDLATQTRMTVARSVWIGEARRLPVENVETVVSGLGELFGAAARVFAEGRGMAPASRPEIAEPPTHPLADRLRQVMGARGAGLFAASLYLAPEAWVLVVPLAHVGSRERDVLETAREISAVLDEGSRGGGR
jgi:hypothetical protein